MPTDTFKDLHTGLEQAEIILWDAQGYQRNREGEGETEGIK